MTLNSKKFINAQLQQLVDKQITTPEIAWEFFSNSDTQFIDFAQKSITKKIESKFPNKSKEAIEKIVKLLKNYSKGRPSKIIKHNNQKREFYGHNILFSCIEIFQAEDKISKEEMQKEKSNLKYNLYIKQEGLCCYCKRPLMLHGSATHIDHIEPKSTYREKTFLIGNFAFACIDCNTAKSDKILEFNPSTDSFYEHIEHSSITSKSTYSSTYMPLNKKGFDLYKKVKLYRIETDWFFNKHQPNSAITKLKFTEAHFVESQQNKKKIKAQIEKLIEIAYEKRLRGIESNIAQLNQFNS